MLSYEQDPYKRFEDFYTGIQYKDIAIRGVKWKHLDVGPANAKTIVFLTGGLKHPLWSFPVLGLLINEYRVIAPILPPVSDIDEILDGAKQILINEGIESCPFIGSSWGGNLVQCFAMKYPATVERMVLSNTGAISSKLMLPALRLHLKSSKKKTAEKLLAEYKKRILTLWSKPPEFASFWAALLDRFYIELFTYEDYITLIENQIGYLERYAFRISDKPYTDPVLYILTKDETASSKSVREKVIKIYPNIVCREFETGGHAVALAHPEEYMDAVHRFIGVKI